MTSKLICLLLARVDAFSLVLFGFGVVLVGGVLIGMLVGLTLKDMGYPDHITLLFPIIPCLFGGIMMMVGIHYNGKEESITHSNDKRLLR